MLGYYYSKNDIKNLRAYHNDRKRHGDTELQGCNIRARVRHEGTKLTLESFYTDIMSYDTATGEVRKLWPYYSATTMKHVRAFVAAYNVPTDATDKATWDKAPTGLLTA